MEREAFGVLQACVILPDEMLCTRTTSPVILPKKAPSGDKHAPRHSRMNGFRVSTSCADAIGASDSIMDEQNVTILTDSA